ncbi:hypothetical protein P3W85_35010 [Cupriavidus basilensis]|uniref:Uncharacterized protein n=1 Tax=Cupriavidus basilensis TaxID=68895 RepID=A0ABT6B0U8_9BURK|nr:hypothetical protein [Cupriavidus basilensis]MDF3838107.1 hypothetical protein [Cupriavidus basilensis]
MYMFAGSTHTRAVAGKAPGVDDLDEHHQIVRIERDTYPEMD